MHDEDILNKFKGINTYLKKSAVLQGIILAVGIMFLSGWASGLLAQLLDKADQGLYKNMFFSLFLGFWSIMWIKVIKGWQYSQVGFKRLNRQQTALSILSGGGIFLLLIVLGSLYASLLPVEAEPQSLSMMAALANSWQQAAAIYLISSILAPIGEEIFFRGALYQSLQEKMGVKKALVITSLIFAAMHFDLYRLVLLWLAGMWLNILRLKCDSICSSMIAHSVWNTLMISLAFFV